MGNQGLKTDTLKNNISAFGREELSALKYKYECMCSKNSGITILEKSALETEFYENKTFGAKIHQWFATHQTKHEGKDGFHSFVRLMEIFIKDTDEYQLAKDFVRMERIEAFALTTLEKFEFSKEEASNLKISYSDSIKIVNEMLKIFKNAGDYYDDETGSRCITNQIFENKQELHDFGFYFYQLKDRLRSMNKFIAYYFLAKFIDPTYARYLTIPKLDCASTILTKQLLTLFWLNNPQFQKVESLNLLYSMTTKGSSLNRLAYSIIGYSGPVLILIKHVDKTPSKEANNPDASSCVFGAYSNHSWREELAYQGNNESFVFSLLPKYKQFQTYKGEGGKNHSYLNTRKIANSRFKPGLGFGGNDFKNFRLWIDEDIENNSYSQPDDSTYEKGFIIRPDITRLNIMQFEIWGLGGEEALRQQEKFREMQAVQAATARKVPREVLLNSQFDREILFEKTFAVANNKREE